MSQNLSAPSPSPCVGLLSRFRGCLAGGLVGDCYGAPYEHLAFPPTSEAVAKFIIKQLEETSEKSPTFQILSYTDDTAMTKCIAQSLFEMRGFDPRDMAKRFALEYNHEPKRGYGGNVVNIFAALMLANYASPYGPAKRQFSGNGSYGNGGAMRIAPVALFGYQMPTKELVELARNTARITHAHSYGYDGAVLQCLAIHQALHAPPGGLRTLADVNHFLTALIDKMTKVETEWAELDAESEPPQTTTNGKGDKVRLPYVDKLRKVKEILNHELRPNATAYRTERVVAVLGNEVSALHSVPTAIYSALRGQLPVEGLSQQQHHPFVRTVAYAISCGGDADTIASMAGTIAGAFYGLEAIPKAMLKHCEAADVLDKYANDLYKLVRCSPISSS